MTYLRSAAAMRNGRYFMNWRRTANRFNSIKCSITIKEDEQ